NLPSNSLLMRSELGKAPEARLPLSRLQDCLVDRGYQEAITYSFVDEAIQNLIAPGERPIRIQNPISSELAIMRTSLWCGLIPAAIYNLNRQQNRLRLFESGLRFIADAGETRQQAMLAGLVLGSVNAEQWGETLRNVDFFDIKADVEVLLALSAGKFNFRAAQHPALHPGQCAEIVTGNGSVVGLLGMLHPNLEKSLGFDSPVFLFELEQDAVLDKTIAKFAALSKFPSVRRDMALLVKQSVSAADILTCIENCREPAIRETVIFDVYQGKGVEDGCKSVALSVSMQDVSQTLTDVEIDAIFSRLLEKLAVNLDAKLRA
ncbi:MAG: phenylalanine--tRNA ligase subunit beta, partial [Methylomonas sp.]